MVVAAYMTANRATKMLWAVIGDDPITEHHPSQPENQPLNYHNRCSAHPLKEGQFERPLKCYFVEF
jgi:hypothetical protein